MSSEDRPAGAVATSDPDTMGDAPADRLDDLPGEPPGEPAADAGTADVGAADAGTADAGTGDAGTADAGTGDGAGMGEGRREPATVKRPRWAWSHGTRGPLALSLALTLVLALTGGVLLARTAQLRDEPAVANRALVDSAASTRVIGDVSSALTKVFSYSYTDTAATGQAARDVLAGAAYKQYEALFSQVMREAPVQGLTVTTRVVRAGVTRLTGDTAQLLVFLDQVVTRGGQRVGNAAAAQLSVTAQLRDGRWRITDIQSR